MATMTDGSKDVQTWLQSLNLGEYVNVFHSHGYFQLNHCAAITESELHSLGIHQTGYKKRILNSISNMNIGKPTLPPRTPTPGSEGLKSSKPDVPLRKALRPPSLDNMEYYDPLEHRNTGSEQRPSKPTIVPRQTMNNHSTRPILPPRRDKPQPRPRVGQPGPAVPGDQPPMARKATIGKIPSLPSSDEDDLSVRPLPPVPGVMKQPNVNSEENESEYNTGILYDLPEPPLHSLTSQDDVKAFVPPLPERPPVIGAEDPPKLPERPELTHSPEPPAMVPPPLPPDRPVILPSADFLPPPLLPERPSEIPFPHPTHIPDSPDELPPPPPRLPDPLPETPPALPERLTPPTSMVPPIPARPAVPYIPDDTAKPLPPDRATTVPLDSDPFHLLDRPVPLPPPVLPESELTKNYDLDRPVPLPPPLRENDYQDYRDGTSPPIDAPTIPTRPQIIENDYNEYVGDSHVDQNGGEVELQNPALTWSSDEEEAEEMLDDHATYDVPSTKHAVVYGREQQDQDINNPPILPESEYDVPNSQPRLSSQDLDLSSPEYSVPPPPRRSQNYDRMEKTGGSIYDIPSSNQRASTSEENLLQFEDKPRDNPPPRPPSSTSHSFSVSPGHERPVSYTNVSSARMSRTSDVLSDDGDSKEYIPLSSAYSGPPPEQSSAFTTSAPTMPVPPPRSRATQRKHENYILLSDASSHPSSSQDINANSDPGEKQNSVSVKYASPAKHNHAPIKPVRAAPPPPPPERKSSLSSISSPKKTTSGQGFDVNEDEYHLVEDHHLVEEEDHQGKLEQSDDYSDDDELDDNGSASPHELQRLKDLQRISDCSMGQGDRLQRQENIRKSQRELRRSMHQRTLQKVSATYSQLPQIGLKEGTDSKSEKSGYLNLYTQSGSQGNRGQKRRYVVFANNELRYYASDKELNMPKGIIPLGTMRDVKYNTNSKERNFKLDLHTNGKVLHFGTENLEDCIVWASTLMQAILSYVPPPGGFPIGGDMSSPDKEGYLKVEGVSSKRYFAIKGEILCMYKSLKDFESAVAICDIEMKLANVREIARARLQLTTPSTQYFLTADSPVETSQWRGAMEEAIQEGLSSRQFLEIVWQNESNKFCAECGMKDPDWASINLGIVICKACSGGHRFLGVHISKVRSLKMDEKVWTEELMRMMVEVGNKNSNAFWESKLNEDDEAKLHPGDTFVDRQIFIKAKYQDFKYCDKIGAEKSFLSRSLLNAVEMGNLRECIKLLFSGADPLFKDDSGRTALDMAGKRHLVAIHELLKQNCDAYERKPSPIAPRALPTVRETKPPSPPPPPPKETSQESIKRSGYLYKTGSNRKDFQKRYCVLEHGVFKYYADEKATIPKNQIEGSEMILIAVAEPKPNHPYCFDLCTSSGRAYLFGADSEEERQRWMETLAKCQTLDCMWNRLESYEFAGYLKKKEGAASTQWQRLWFIMRGQFMFFFSAIKNDEDFIDLRKLKSLSMDDSKGESEEQMKISFVMPKKNLYFTTETDEARKLWFEKFKAAFNASGPLLEEQPLSETDVPLIITACMNFVEDHEGLDLEGVYRKSGSASAIRKITSLFYEEPRAVTQALKEGDFEVHDVTSSLKKYFRDLPNPLLNKELYSHWIQASAEEHNTKLHWYKDLLSSLPTINYAILKDLICHLRKVDANREKNSMNATNLGTVFGPTLMASSDPLSSNFQNAEKEINVILDLITYYNWLFDVETDSVEDDKKKKEQEALDKLKLLNSQQIAAEFIVEIFNGRKPANGDGVSFSIKISETTTAQELIAKSIDQRKVLFSPRLALFEIVSKGDLERLLLGYEYVLQDIMGWNNDFGNNSGSYMCIMEDYLTPRIELYMRVLSSSDFVKFQEGRKGFKKMYFELNQNVLNAYKDRQTPSATYQWKVSEMKIYIGHDKKKAPPTQHCLAFTTPKDQGFRHLSFETEEALNTWLGALYKSKMSLKPAGHYYDITDFDRPLGFASMEQSSLPIPSSTFNTPFTRPQAHQHSPQRRKNFLHSITRRLSISDKSETDA